MKLHALCASAVALALVSTPAKAELDNPTVKFIVRGTMALVVNIMCDSYEQPDGSVRSYADRLGVDFETYGPATFNGMRAQINGMKYDREALIPEVTRVVAATMDVMDKASKPWPAKKAQWCKYYGGIIVDETGMLKVKGISPKAKGDL
ncbi:hypothetical protein [Bradyrhizobium diazoefficiens]|nr:hypothetical protein XF16B_45640 [Bradyrhizobium diazoefficiens]BCF70217.1 hypothetical protein XF19B_45700 [Bradyrhizobium diazoefficiens]